VSYKCIPPSPNPDPNSHISSILQCNEYRDSSSRINTVQVFCVNRNRPTAVSQKRRSLVYILCPSGRLYFTSPSGRSSGYIRRRPLLFSVNVNDRTDLPYKEADAEIHKKGLRTLFLNGSKDFSPLIFSGIEIQELKFLSLRCTALKSFKIQIGDSHGI
jgi:hypothetical protein